MRIIISVFILAVFAYWFYKRQQGKKHLAALEQGRSCVACQSIEVTPEANGIRCNKCGHLTDLAWLNRAQVTSKDTESLPL